MVYHGHHGIPWSPWYAMVYHGQCFPWSTMVSMVFDGWTRIIMVNHQIPSKTVVWTMVYHGLDHGTPWSKFEDHFDHGEPGSELLSDHGLPWSALHTMVYHGINCWPWYTMVNHSSKVLLDSIIVTIITVNSVIVCTKGIKTRKSAHGSNIFYRSF